MCFDSRCITTVLSTSDLELIYIRFYIDIYLDISSTMAPAPLAPGFTLREAAPEELPTLLKILLLAVDSDPMWRRGVRDCSFDALYEWIINSMGWRWLAPDVTSYVIVEDATG